MNIGFLITARLKSTRLPYKILLDLNGKTVIERIIDRIKEIKGIAKIVLCTSTNPQDEPLIDIAKRNGIHSFAGDEEDVLKRLLDASKVHNLDYFLGITADNPLITIEYSNLIMEKVKTDQFDFIKIIGLPFGSATYAMRIKALETVCKIKQIIDTEIWGYLIDRPEIFRIEIIEATGELHRPELRFTLDYKEDFQMINDIYRKVPFSKVLDLYEVIKYLDNNPNNRDINKECVQLDLDNKIKEDIDNYYKNNFEQIQSIKKKIYGN